MQNKIGKLFTDFINVLFVVTIVIGSIKTVEASDLRKIFQSMNMDVIFASDTTKEKEIKAMVIDDYLLENDSPVVGFGNDFVRHGDAYGVDPYLMVGMSGTESGFGKYGYATEDTYNLVGLGVHEGRRYTNWSEGIEDMARVLKNYYIDEGRTTTKLIQDKWAPRGVDNNGNDDNWAYNVDCIIEVLKRKEKETIKG